jgi:hypothetical protein
MLDPRIPALIRSIPRSPLLVRRMMFATAAAMPRVRFPLGRMMFAVAILGVALGFVARRERFLRLSVLHAHLNGEILFENKHGRYGPYPGQEDALPGHEREWDLDQRLAGYHWMLHEKYERAARYPWLPVAPDPPEPK